MVFKLTKEVHDFEIENEAMKAENLPFKEAFIDCSIEADKKYKMGIDVINHVEGLYANPKAIMFLSVAIYIEPEGEHYVEGIFGWITVEKSNSNYDVYFDPAGDDWHLAALGRDPHFFNYDASINVHEELMKWAFHRIMYVAGKCYRNKKQFLYIKKYSKKEHKREIKDSKHSINLCDGITCYCSDDSDFVRDYVRHTESWEVRGHYRHYKSGKTVYVRPHIKGQGKLSDKKYLVD